MCSDPESASYHNHLCILSHIDTCSMRPTEQYQMRPCDIVILSMFKELMGQAFSRFDKLIKSISPPRGPRGHNK